MVKNPPPNAENMRDSGLISGLRRSPGGGHGNPLQHSCLVNPMDRGAWQATVHRVAKSQTQLSDSYTHTHTHTHTHTQNFTMTFSGSNTPVSVQLTSVG